MEREYFVGVDKVKQVELEEDLGVRIDTKLDFDENRKIRIRKANNMAGAIRRSFKFLDRYTFVKLYKTMVKCHIESAVVVWFPYKIKNIEEVESVQKRATKMLPETKNLCYEDRLHLLNLPTLVTEDIVET